MTPRKQVRAAIYVRLSRDPDGLSTSTADQERECRELAERKGWTVVEVYRDNDVPASEAQAIRKRKRIGYANLLQAVSEDRIDAILVWATDRLYRHPRDLEDLITLLEERNVPLETVRSGVIDLSSADGRMIARQLAAVNKREVEVLADRARRKAASNARAGLPHGGSRSFGYAKDRITIVSLEAEAIRDAARRLLNGESLSSVTAVWNAQGLTTTRGNPWKMQVVRRLLLQPRIAGLREHRGEVYPATWEPIIDPRTWGALRDLLKDPRRLQPHTRGKYLLTNLLICGKCGARMTGQPVRGVAAYACLRGHGGCSQARIMAAQLEEYVCRRTSEVALAETRSVPEPHKMEKRLVKAIETEEAKLAQLARDRYDRGVIGDVEYQAAATPIRERLAALEAELAATTGPPAETWSAVWAEVQAIPDVTFSEWLSDPAVRADVRAELERKVAKISVRAVGKNGRWAKRPAGGDGKPIGPARPAPVSRRVSITWKEGVEELLNARS
ncbi:MAG TPA: recombinase family protein [Actinomycetota bacterium]